MRILVSGSMLLLLALGTLWLIVQGRLADRGLAAWPTVPGQLLSIEAVQETDVIQSRSESNRRSTAQIRLIARYRYEVDGRTYSGDRLATRPFIQIDEGDGVTRDDMVEVLKSHREGSTIRVHHHPTEPERSYVIYRPAYGSTVLLVLLIAFALLGIGAIATGIVQMRASAS